jgi:hypothetical protein
MESGHVQGLLTGGYRKRAVIKLIQVKITLDEDNCGQFVTVTNLLFTVYKESVLL